MNYFAPFFFATLGILIALFLGIFPFFFFHNILRNYREENEDYESTLEDFDEFPNLMNELIDEYIEYLTEKENYEKIEKINDLKKNYLKNRVSIPEILKILEVFYVYLEGPEIDSYSGREGSIVFESPETEEYEARKTIVYLVDKKPTTKLKSLSRLFLGI